MKIDAPVETEMVEFLLNDDSFIDQLAKRLSERVRLAGTSSPLLTPKEAADYLRCSRQRVYDLCSQNHLTHEKEGSRTLIRREELDRHLKRVEANIPDGNWE